MATTAQPDLRYPTGPFVPRATLTPGEREQAIATIERTPREFAAAVRGLNERQLETPYRPGGWTVRQLAHHVPDSHMNAYIRFKLAMTEDVPTIKPYDESKWAELPDTKRTPVESSLRMLELIHERWLNVLRAMTPADFDRRLVHPERGEISLDFLLGMYAWHGPHHTAHVTSLRQREGW